MFVISVLTLGLAAAPRGAPIPDPPRAQSDAAKWRAALAAGDLAAADAEWKKAPSGLPKAYLRLAAAARALAAGDRASARKALDPPLSSPWDRRARQMAVLAFADEPERLLALARSAEPGAPVLGAVLERLPKTHPSRAALQKRLWREAPSVGETPKVPELNREEWFERLGHLERQHASEQLRREAAQVRRFVRDPEAHCRLDFWAGKAERKLRRYRSAIAKLRRAARVCAEVKNAAFEAKSLLVLSQVLQIRRDTDGLEWVAERFRRHFSTHRYRDDVLVLWGTALARRGRAQAALVPYREVLAERPRSDEAPIAAWRIALSAMDRGDDRAARDSLTRLLEHPGLSPMHRARARYWLARSTEATAPKAAQKLYRRLAEGLSFYGFAALSELRVTRPAWAAEIEGALRARRIADPAEAPSRRPAEILAGPKGTAARALAAWGEAALASAWLEDTLAKETPLVQAEVWTALSDHAAAQRVLRPRVRRGPWALYGPKTRAVWRMAYSRPYASALSAAAQASGLEDAWLLVALAREESTFDPEIVSWAGAVGLSQLMPATAEGAHRAVFRRTPYDPARLVEPSYNARLGAHVLRAALDAFGTPPLALAAYNGGHGLARAILPKKRMRFVDWLERVGVRETRRYMRRVSETWATYRYLYDDARPFVSLPRHAPAR